MPVRGKFFNEEQVFKKSTREGKVVYKQAKKTCLNNPNEGFVGQLSSRYFRN